MLNEIVLTHTDLNLLVWFETVLARHNVGLATVALNLSPSAVSHGPGRFWRRLNDPLVLLDTPRGDTHRTCAGTRPRFAEILQGMRAVLGTAGPPMQMRGSPRRGAS